MCLQICGHVSQFACVLSDSVFPSRYKYTGRTMRADLSFTCLICLVVFTEVTQQWIVWWQQTCQHKSVRFIKREIFFWFQWEDVFFLFIEEMGNLVWGPDHPWWHLHNTTLNMTSRSEKWGLHSATAIFLARMATVWITNGIYYKIICPWTRVASVKHFPGLDLLVWSKTFSKVLWGRSVSESGTENVHLSVTMISVQWNMTQREIAAAIEETHPIWCGGWESLFSQRWAGFASQCDGMKKSHDFHTVMCCSTAWGELRRSNAKNRRASEMEEEKGRTDV